MKVRGLLLLVGLAGTSWAFQQSAPNPPIITTTCPVPGATAGAPYSFSVSVTGGYSPYTFNLVAGSLPTGLTLEPNGVVDGIPTQTGSFPFVILVMDVNEQTASYSCTITVVAALAITSGCPSSGVINSPFSYAVTATGGIRPYTYALTGGALPAGLTLNSSTGLISGTPGAAGSASFSIQVLDSVQQMKTLTCSITINAPRPPALAIISGCPVSSIAQGLPYAQTLSASGGNGTYIWAISAGSLPAGLILKGDRISGTTAGPLGMTRFSIQVSSEDQTVEQSCALPIVSQRLQITSDCPADGTQGVPYPPFVLTAIGGGAPSTYVFSIINGTLPAGLSLIGNTISGTPKGPPSRSSFTIRVTSGDLTATAGPCSMNIAQVSLGITGTCPSTAQVGSPVSSSITASGGNTPYTFSFTGSPWLSFQNGTVTGTPPSVGSGSFSVKVTDATSASQTFSCSFPITIPLNIEASCPAGSVAPSAPFSLPLGATGGKSPYSWSLSGPPWMALSSATGDTISILGTPPAVGTFPYSVTLSDSAGSPAATLRCTLTVIAALQITSSTGCPASPLALGSAATIALTGVGGAPPYNWTLSGPSWLSFSSSTGASSSSPGASTTLSGTAATVGTASFIVTLSDSANTIPARFSCNLIVNLPTTVTITGPTTPTTSGQDQPVQVRLGSGIPNDLQGRLTMTFTPEQGLPNDPSIQFQNGQRTFDFSAPAGSTSLPQVAVKTGTVAGVIVITPSFTAGGVDVTPTGVNPVRIQLARAAPTLTAVDCVRTSTSVFNVIADGFTNTREATDAQFTFQGATGANLATTQLPVSAGQLFVSWFGSTGSAAAGGTFRYTQTFNVQGNSADIQSITVRLSNSIGASAPGNAACHQ